LTENKGYWLLIIPLVYGWKFQFLILDSLDSFCNYMLLTVTIICGSLLKNLTRLLLLQAFDNDVIVHV